MGEETRLREGKGGREVTGIGKGRANGKDGERKKRGNR